MKIWHTSDIHLSFGDNDEIKKPMDQRSWSKGSPNYVGYLEKLSDFGLNQIDNGDLVLISGDLTHEMKQQYAARNLRWVRKNTRGHIVLCGGNHDQKIDFKLVRLESIGENIHLLSPGEMISIGEYTVGCFSDHKQQADIEDASEYLDMAAKIVAEASKRKTKPIMMSHYPVSLEIAQKIGELGVMVYVSGHVHCTSNKTADGNDWTWYDKQVKPTDDQVINGCYFSTGTTDILLNKINQIYRQITHGTSSNFVAGNSSNLREQAAKAFGCHIKFVDKFEKQDPFNPGNVVSGFMCHQKNVMNGSLFITHINGVKVANQLIYGTPKLAYPYKPGTTEYIDFHIVCLI
jgi:predicted phosphohydrolase